MIDFKIKKGLSTDLYVEPGVVNPRLIIEAGCWYLCTDTAELFLGVYAKDENGQDFLTLKQINGTHEGGSAEVDLTGYAKLTDIPDVSEFIKEIPAEYVTEAELEAKGYLTEHQDISGKADKEHTHSEYALKTDIPDVSNFITSIPTEYLTETELSARGYLTHKDLEGLAQNKDVLDLTAEVATVGAKVAVLENNADNYLTAVPAEYITESELNARGYLQHQALAGYATESFVDAKIEAIPQPDLSEYAKKADIPSVNGLATEEFVISEIAKAELSGGEVSEEELNQLLVNYYTKTESYSKSEVDAKIGSIQIPSIEGLATESYVDEAINNIDFPETDLTGYAKLTDIPDVSEFIKDIPAEYVTEEELTAKGYLTDHQDLSHLAEKDHVHEGYAAKEHTHDQYLTEQDISGKADKEHSHSYNDLTDKPVIPSLDDYAKKDELFSKDYNELTNKPELFSGSYNDLSDKPELFSGDYNSLTNKPEIPNIEGLATEAFVTEEIKKIEIPEAYDDSEIRELINSKATSDHSHDEYALTEHTHDEYLTEHQSLAEYAKKSELFSKDYNDLTNKPTIPSLEGYATKTFVDENYYDKAEVGPFITKVEALETFKTDVTTNYATKQYVIDAIDTHEGIAKKAEVEEVKTKLDTEILPIVPTVQELVETAATQEWVAHQKYLQNKYEVLPVEGMFVLYGDNEVRINTQRVVPALQNVGEGGSPNMYYVTFRAYAPEGATQVIEGQSDKLDTEFSQLATDANGRKYTTIWAAIANTADGGNTWTKWGDSSTVDKYLGFYYNFHWYNEDTLISTDKVRVILTNDSCHNDLVPDAVARRIDEKVAAVEVPSIVGLATEEFVNRKIAEAELADKEADLEAYYTKSEVDALIPEVPTKVSELENDASYITSADIPEAEIYKVDFNAPDYAKAVEAYNNGKVLVLINAAPDINSYAVMNYVSEKYITFTKFLTSRSEAYGSFNTYYLSPANTWEISKEVRLNKVEANVDGEVNGELTNIRIGKEVYSLPSIAGLATEDFVQQELAKIEHPTVDLSGLVTLESFNSALAEKADKVPFTTDKFVTRSVGGFVEGESIKGLTIAELFAKLLGLSDDKPGENPEEPDAPGEGATPEEIADYLIATETPIYSQDDQGVLVASDFGNTTWTEEEAAVQMNGVSTFYQIVDDTGSVIESGYQEATTYNETDWLTVALPNTVTSFSIKKYDGLSNGWFPVNFEMEKAVNQTIEGYTIWTVPEEYEIMAGSTLRFVIE